MTRDIATAVRSWARDVPATEAGVELLIRAGRFVYDGAPWIKWHGDQAAIDVDTLLYEQGLWSSGEQALARIACSLLGGPPVDLRQDVPLLDQARLELVLAAVAHASGSNGQSDRLLAQDGTPTEIGRLPSAYPWPEGSGIAKTS